MSLRDPTLKYPLTIWLAEYAWTHEQEDLRRLRAWWGERRTTLESGSAGRRTLAGR